jgi:glycerol-3-phosphate dehydrogenase
VEGLRGGVVYYDGQFDDAVCSLIWHRPACDQGAVLLNYVEVTGIEKDIEGSVAGVPLAI